MHQSAALTLAVALAAGMIAQSLAVRLGIPGIVLLLLGGVLLGPDVANVVQPAQLGGALQTIVNFAVAVILFDGAMGLEVKRLRREGQVIRRLITVGGVVTGVGATLAAWWIMAWPWAVAIPFGALLVVTGPTVVTPLLRRIRPNRNLHTILEAEGVLIDPIGAILGLVALEVVLSHHPGSAALRLLGGPSRLVVGAAAGAVGGYVLARLLRSDSAIPSGLEGVFTLAFLLALYECVETLLPGSGIMSATVAGLVVGNMRGRVSQELKEFKEQLAVMLVGLLFILLAADVRLGQVTNLGWPGLAMVVVLMFVVRPLDVAASTRGSALSVRERAFLAWISPRGIVAAGVASVFAERLAQEGIPEGAELQALVFLLIAASVLVQGLSGVAVARLLRVRRPSNTGWVLAGANPLGRALARALQAEGEEVVLIDSNATEAREAEGEGLRVLLGNALDDGVLRRADLDARRGVLSTIPNEGTALLLAQRARRLFQRRAWLAVRPNKRGVRARRLAEVGARLLFGCEADIERWTRELRRGAAVVRQVPFQGEVERPLAELEGEMGGAPAGRVLPLAVCRGRQVFPVDEETRLRPGDVVTLAMAAATPAPGEGVREGASVTA